MEKFNVISYDFNKDEFVSYDVIPFFVDEYDKAEYKPSTKSDWNVFVRQSAVWMFAGRCEYEVILKSWPTGNTEKKIDIYNQIMMNFDLVVELIRSSIYSRINES